MTGRQDGQYQSPTGTSCRGGERQSRWKLKREERGREGGRERGGGGWEIHVHVINQLTNYTPYLYLTPYHIHHIATVCAHCGSHGIPLE